MPHPISFACAAAACLAPMATSLSAHEFWIEPLSYQVGTDGSLLGRLVNGSYFDGVNIAYFPNRIIDFSAYLNGTRLPIVARAGTNPALQIPAPGDGLVIVGYQSTMSELTYEDGAVFRNFVRHKDLETEAASSDARGIPADGFGEVYTRFSKSLIAAGSGAGSDMRIGFETEFVLRANPYIDDLSAGLPVQLFYGDAVRANEQVEMFARTPGDDQVEITYYRTDDQGIAILPVRPGMEYMIDAVLLREPSPEIAASTGAVWETLWANMTFMVPER